MKPSEGAMQAVVELSKGGQLCMAFTTTSGARIVGLRYSPAEAAVIIDEKAVRPAVQELVEALTEAAEELIVASPMLVRINALLAKYQEAGDDA